MHRRSLIAAAGLALLVPGRGRAQQATDDSLEDKGAPRGRVGGATRSGPGALALDLVAPLRGIGTTAAAAPTLFYILSAAVAKPMRVTVTMRGQAQPLLDAPLPPAPRGGLYPVATAGLGLRLEPARLYVWSVVANHDPAAPSNDVVASALLQYRPSTPDVAAAPSGYWYDAVAAAERARGRDGGAALAALLRAENLEAAMNGAA